VLRNFLVQTEKIDLKHLYLDENIEDLDLAGEINNFFATVATGL